MAFWTIENNNTKEITIPKNEIKKDWATEYLNTLLEERNNEPLSNMDQELKDKITEWNFDKTQKIKHIPEMQKWYNEEWNLTKIHKWLSDLKKELPFWDLTEWLTDNELNSMFDKDWNSIRDDEHIKQDDTTPGEEPIDEPVEDPASTEMWEEEVSPSWTWGSSWWNWTPNGESGWRN